MKGFKERVNPTTTIKVFQAFVPQIEIHPEALAKMQIFVDICGKEVGWLGTAYQTNQNTILIRDVFLFDQEVHATTTEITPEGLSDFAQEILTQPDGVETWNNLKLWGHSHVNMAVNPSGQDDKQMETFADGGHDWFLRIIANKSGDMKVDLYNYSTGVIYLDLPWYESEDEESARINAQINALYKQLDALKAGILQAYETPLKQEIKVKVREKTYSSYPTQWQGGKGGTGYTSQQPASKQTQVGFQTTGKEVKTTSTQANGGDGTTTTKSESKKKESEETDDETHLGISNLYGDDLPDAIDSFDDLDAYFYIRDIIKFGTSDNIVEMIAEIEDLGYGDYFNMNDLRRIYQFSQAYCRANGLII